MVLVVFDLFHLDAPMKNWEMVLPESLHAIRSLLCTATNSTPHERMFSYGRKTSSGSTVPTWLLTSGPILLKRYNTSSKYDPKFDTVELIETNPAYAYVRYPDGRTDSVSINDLAPLPSNKEKFCDESFPDVIVKSDSPSMPPDAPDELLDTLNTEEKTCDTPCSPDPPKETLRRSTRLRQPPERYGY